MAPTDSRARLALLTGPSGVGKGTLVARLLERHPQVWLSVSATTRSPRDGEQQGFSTFSIPARRLTISWLKGAAGVG